jgi:hypothetical protein
MQLNFTFEYSIGEKVQIIELGKFGYVTALHLSMVGPQYYVSYFDKGERRSEYLFPIEIEKVENPVNSKTGFKVE